MKKVSKLKQMISDYDKGEKVEKKMVDTGKRIMAGMPNPVKNVKQNAKRKK